jgi:hypothetical protein
VAVYLAIAAAITLIAVISMRETKGISARGRPRRPRAPHRRDRHGEGAAQR